VQCSKHMCESGAVLLCKFGKSQQQAHHGLANRAPSTTYHQPSKYPFSRSLKPNSFPEALISGDKGDAPSLSGTGSEYLQAQVRLLLARQKQGS
jgi:hypothetical protein